MIPPVPNTPDDIAATIAYLLPGNHPKPLRALSFSFTPYGPSSAGRIVVRAHFFKPPSEADLELIKDLEAELYAQTNDQFEYAVEAETTPIGYKMHLLPNTAWIDGAEQHRRS